MEVLIITCDSYQWMMPIFTHFYKKYWPDNPYNTVIITETQHIESEYPVFYAGKTSWSNEILDYIRQSDDESFLLILEDYLLRKKVNTEKVKLAKNICVNKIGCVRLNNAPEKYFNQHTLRTGIKGFREYPIKRRFSWTMQIAFWQKQFLLDTMREGESAWESEENGIERLKNMKTDWEILWPEENIVDYNPIGLMRKGILEPKVLKWAKSELDKNSKEYKILENQIKKQSEMKC